jgi:hypothetical protein
MAADSGYPTTRQTATRETGPPAEPRIMRRRVLRPHCAAAYPLAPGDFGSRAAMWPGRIASVPIAAPWPRLGSTDRCRQYECETREPETLQRFAGKKARRWGRRAGVGEPLWSRGRCCGWLQDEPLGRVAGVKRRGGTARDARPTPHEANTSNASVAAANARATVSRMRSSSISAVFPRTVTLVCLKCVAIEIRTQCRTKSALAGHLDFKR